VPLQIVCFCSNLMHSHLYYSCITPYTNTMLLAPYSLSQWNSSRRFTANGLPIHYTNWTNDFHTSDHWRSTVKRNASDMMTFSSQQKQAVNPYFFSMEIEQVLY
jgi:hypothetical protein